MLELAGYEVVSSEGFASAVENCNSDFDLIIMGHSIPQKDKRAILVTLNEHGCDAPLLSLLRPGEQKLPEAAHAVDPQNPADLLKAVQWMLGQKARA